MPIFNQLDRKKNMKAFNDYLTHSRAQFVKKVNEQDWNTQLRTAAESFVIAFDQLKEGFEVFKIAISPQFIKANFEKIEEQEGCLILLNEIIDMAIYIEKSGKFIVINECGLRSYFKIK